MILRILSMMKNIADLSQKILESSFGVSKQRKESGGSTLPRSWTMTIHTSRGGSQMEK